MKRAWLFNLILIFLVMIKLVLAIPTVSFVDPTPIGNISENYAYVNLSTSGAEHYSFVDFDNDLVLWMRMDDVDGSGNPIDLSSYGNNGSLSGALINSASGYYGNGCYLDGSNDRVIVPDSSSLDSPGVTDQLTICSWINIDNHGSGFKGIVGKWNSQRQYLLAKDDGTNKYGLILSSNGGSHTSSGAELFTDSGLNTDQWYHLCGTYNGSNMYIYLDGVKQSGTADSQGINDVSTAYLEIGSFNQGTTFTFDGSIDEVMIFKRGLEEDEIKSLYNASTNQYENNFTSLADGDHTFNVFAVNESDIVSVKRTVKTGYTIPQIDNLPIITVDSPSFLVTFKTNVSDDYGIANVSLMGNWSGTWQEDQVNSSGINNASYIFNKNFYSPGTYQWAFNVYDSSGQLIESENKTFSVVFF